MSKLDVIFAILQVTHRGRYKERNLFFCVGGPSGLSPLKSRFRPNRGTEYWVFIDLEGKLIRSREFYVKVDCKLVYPQYQVHF